MDVDADVTSKKVGALPSLMMGCARFIGFHIPYKHITLEALAPVSRCDRDWVGLTWKNASAQGDAALRGTVSESEHAPRNSLTRTLATATARRLPHKTVSDGLRLSLVSGVDWRFVKEEVVKRSGGVSWLH